MTSSTGHPIAVVITLLQLYQLLPLISTDEIAASEPANLQAKSSDDPTALLEQRLIFGSGDTPWEQDTGLFAYPREFIKSDARFSTDDARYEQYYDCYCNTTMEQFDVTLECDKMLDNSKQDKDDANWVILNEAGIADSIFHRSSLLQISVKCTLKVYYDDVYNCYCESLQDYYKTNKLPCDQMKENTENDLEAPNDKILQDNGVVFYWYTRLRLKELWAKCVFSSLKKKQDILNKAQENLPLLENGNKTQILLSNSLNIIS